VSADAALVDLFRRELELCKVTPEETVAVLSEGDIRADYAQAFMVAAQSLGAQTFHVNVPPRLVHGGFAGNFGHTAIGGNRPVIEALKAADLVIDLMLLLFSAEQNEITASGTRMLLVVEPVEVLSRLLPTESLRTRVEAAGERLARASQLTISSAAGTDVTYSLGTFPTITEYGYTDQPGRWDHWPSGFVFTGACEEGVNGTVVLAPGDILCAFRRYVQQPVTLRIEEGYVVAIEGEGLDASLMRNYMAGFDRNAYAISHIGWGLNELAQWHHMAVADPQRELGMDALSFYGNVLFSTGPNTELGGTNDTACHLDMPLRNCTLVLDGEDIVRDGDVIPPIMRASWP
jgi:2,5-dihydroxypyridine 5,6-dioxygenase